MKNFKKILSFILYFISGITKYYYNVANAGLFQKFAFKYCDKNRSILKKCKTRYMETLTLNLPVIYN